MNTEFRRVKDIFLAALERRAGDERDGYLRDTCEDEAMRRQVEALLARHEQAGSFLEAPPPNLETTVARTDTAEQPGAMIGPYKLLEQLGEGGFGVVFMAEQIHPVRRRVALKILKSGLDNRQVVARFEAERQALALMDHTNIAKVFDGGEAESGRPYFVMELVRGTPITDYCNQSRLPTQQRLELFAAVCAAVQHAHQKGIIHRDIKPSNVLVSQHDATPVVKVIDFGIAKALGQELTDKTLFTGFAQMIGTPLYMSPEQAGMSDLDVDTRSDVYSLGVLLYELLTGTTPFTKDRFRQASYDEIRRIIREEEPPRPSTRLSESGDTLVSISAQRQTDPVRLTKQVRGELDWIVMKALEKDRNRRYESPSAFAADVGRFLADEPVQACPPSAGYRLRKFLRRNRSRALVAAMILFFTALLTAGAGWFALDRTARRTKTSNNFELAAERTELFLGQRKRVEARASFEQAERLSDELRSDAVRNRLADLKERLEDDERDQAFVTGYEAIRSRVATRVDVRNSRFTPEAVFPEIGSLFSLYGITFVETPPDQAVALMRKRPAQVFQQLIAALYDSTNGASKSDPRAWYWLRAVIEAADNDPWRVAIRQAALAGKLDTVTQLIRDVDVRQQPPAFLIRIADILPVELKPVRLAFLRRIQRAHPSDLWANHALGMGLTEHGRHGEAIRYFTAALVLAPDNPGIYLNRGNCLSQVGEQDGAIADYQQCLTLAPNYATALANYAGVLRRVNRANEALILCNQAIDTNPALAEAWANRGLVYLKLNELDKSVQDSTKAIELKQNLEAAWTNRGEAHRLLGQYKEAIADCTRAIELDKNSGLAWANRADCYLQLQDYKQCISDSTRAIALEPLRSYAWYVRGAAHGALGDHEKAVADCSRAVELEPSNATAHYNFGIVLFADGKGNPKGAIAAYRKAIELDDQYAEPHCNLSGVLHQQGQYREALKEVRRGHELGIKQPRWPYPSGEWVKKMESLAAMDERLADVLSGKTKLGTPKERIELARFCVRKEAYRVATRFYEEAIPSPMKLPPGLNPADRFDAACAAVRAGCGKGRDANELDDAERARLRSLALEWARADMDAIEEMTKQVPVSPHVVVGILQGRRDKPDFVDVRDAESLARLPEDEQKVWRKHWDALAKMSDRFKANAATQAQTKTADALAEKGLRKEAITAYSEAIRLNEKNAPAYYGLGNMYFPAQLDKAIAAYRKAIELDPNDPRYHVNLGNSLAVKGDLNDAIGEYQKAIKLDKNLFEAHINLGRALQFKDQLEEAIAEYRAAIRINGRSAQAHFFLGSALQALGDLDGAVAALVEALRIQKDHAEAREQLREAERLVGLAKRLPAILAGKDEAKDAAEALGLAHICRTQTRQQYAATARFFGEALAKDAKLAENLERWDRYNAACAAALAAAGRGKDAANLDAKEQARLRQRALEWLRADLKVWDRVIDMEPEKSRMAADILSQWLTDTDFDAVHSPDLVEKLPAEEQKLWKSLWADVADAAKRARAKVTPGK